MLEKLGRDLQEQVQKLTGRKVGGTFNEASPPTEPVPEVLTGDAADMHFRSSKAWKSLLGGLMDDGYAEPDPTSTTRMRQRSGGYTTYLEKPNDIVQFLHGDHVLVLRAQNGGSVFKGKPLQYKRDGLPLETFMLTHYSTAPTAHKVQVFDSAGREITDPAARNQKILNVMAAMQHHRDPQNRFQYFGDLHDLAQKTGLVTPKGPFLPVQKTTGTVLPVKIMKPVTLRSTKPAAP